MIYTYCKNIINLCVKDICSFLKSNSLIKEFDLFEKNHKDNDNKVEEHNLLDEVYINIDKESIYI